MIKITARWHKSIKEIRKESWNNLLPCNISPVFQWEWLNALEKSQSISAASGWQPLFLILWEGKSPIAAAPLYLKSHSFGEFVYDQVFIQLAHDLGLEYYPKIVGMSPLSPIEGYRFFFAKGVDEEKLTILMMEKIDIFASSHNILSCNFLYVDPKWEKITEVTSCAKWINQKSLWTWYGEKNFSEYLAKFNANQRRNIKRERNHIKSQGIKISVIKEDQITVEYMKRMYCFYKEHCEKWGIWGSKYLSSSFFEDIAISKLRNKVILFCAFEENSEEPIAMSLCIKDENMLWGRYWGTNKEIDFLHFELCYYSPISWAIDNGIKYFDPGAGGGHKRRRGFIAKPYTSLHRWYSPRMNSLIKDWLPKVNRMMINEIEATNNDVPFKSKKPLLTEL